MIVMPLEEDDGFPVLVFKAAIDAIGFAFHFVDEVLVAADVCTAGSADLDEGEAAYIRRIALEKALDAAEALGNAFGVVEAIHANSEVIRLDSQLFLQPVAFLTQH